MKKEIVVAVSGYWTILHKGHIKLFERAKKFGDKLVVIVNNEKQQVNKKGELIHEVEDIKYILKSLRMVDKVIISIDKDGTVCKTLKKLNPDVFANGGDRVLDNVPEVEICKSMGIIMRWNVGGKKMLSSSEIIRRTG
ncbi:MAG: adenylyltransferase/cytidyltransferase family protein [Halanaerobiales bacterium]|nr:adenylyltransferase/cytidyltransferase family protein [Halanaerobiales bacterium]